ARLVELEYLLLHKRGLTFCYELLFDGDAQADNAHLCGLIDVPEVPAETVTMPEKENYDADRSGVKEKRSASGRGAVGGRSDKVIAIKASTDKASTPSGRVNGKATAPVTHDKPVVP
ncbi:DNA primase, partial [Dickeya undicola]